jgi:hypothetical protein
MEITLERVIASKPHSRMQRYSNSGRPECPPGNSFMTPSAKADF